jgi:hypothetical protein
MVRNVVPWSAPAQWNTEWAMDFMGDSFHSNRSYRLLNVLDEGYRGGLPFEVGFSLPITRVLAVLYALAAQSGGPLDQTAATTGPSSSRSRSARSVRRTALRSRTSNLAAETERRYQTLQSELSRGNSECLALHQARRRARRQRRVTVRLLHRAVRRSFGNVPPLTFAPILTRTAQSNINPCA